MLPSFPFLGALFLFSPSLFDPYAPPQKNGAQYDTDDETNAEPKDSKRLGDKVVQGTEYQHQDSGFPEEVGEHLRPVLRLCHLAHSQSYLLEDAMLKAKQSLSRADRKLREQTS
jgi:hypothetical protein